MSHHLKETYIWGGGARSAPPPPYVWRRAKRAALYVWCEMLREALCVPSIYRRVRLRSCTIGQVTSVKHRFRYDLWAPRVFLRRRVCGATLPWKLPFWDQKCKSVKKQRN